MKTPLNALSLAILLATSHPQAAEVNPFTGTEASIADLRRQLEIANLENQIAVARANKQRTEREAKEPKPTPAALDPKFGTLKYPTEKIPFFPGLDALFKPQKGKGETPSPSTAPAVQAAPPMPAGPRLIGIISDEAGRVAIIEQGGVLQQAKENGTAHGQKVSRIGAGWADLGGKRLTQDTSTLALVVNVDKQPAMRPAGSASPAAGQPMAAPSAQPAAFMPPGFPQ